MLAMERSDEIDSLFRRYVMICNAAMQQHKEAFPYKQIWDALERQQKETAFDISILDDEPSRHYQLSMKDKHIDVLSCDDDNQCPRKINASYLRKVVEHPEEYLANPAKLDWDWLQQTVR